MIIKRKSRFLLWSLSILVFWMPSSPLAVSSINSIQKNASWAAPQTIPGYDKSAWPPILIADQNRQVHAFSSQWINNDSGESFSAIVYNRWTLKDGWTRPVDILLSPSREARLTDAYLDSKGKVNLVFWAGDNTAANIYYSQSDLETVDQIQSWSTPVQVAENVGDPPSATLEEDSAGDLLLIYHGRLFGNGVYVVKSQDQGTTWLQPVAIFLTDPIAPFAWNVQVRKGSSGWLHVIWNVLTVGGEGRGIYYTRTQNGDEWATPILLDFAKEGYGTQTPAIIEHDNELLAFLVGINMRKSLDNGETWSDPGRIFSRHVGVNGSLSPVIDGSGVLHLFFGQRITASPDIHGMWHSTYLNGRWTEPEAVVRGPQVVDRVGDNSFDPYEARAVVSQGNVLLVTWRTDPGLRGNGVWYSYAVLDIPEKPIATSISDISLGVSLTPSGEDDVGQIEAVLTVTPSEHNDRLLNKTQSTVYNFGYLIFWGVLPVIVLIILLLISRYHYINRH